MVTKRLLRANHYVGPAQRAQPLGRTFTRMRFWIDETSRRLDCQVYLFPVEAITSRSEEAS